jgi:TetR/AcrR family transcriptional repressor of nem operon
VHHRGLVGVHPDAELAVALLAAVQGGLLLSQIRRDHAPLEIAVNTMINHLRTLTT